MGFAGGKTDGVSTRTVGFVPVKRIRVTEPADGAAVRTVIGGSAGSGGFSEMILASKDASVGVKCCFDGFEAAASIILGAASKDVLTLDRSARGSAGSVFRVHRISACSDSSSAGGVGGRIIESQSIGGGKYDPEIVLNFSE